MLKKKNSGGHNISKKGMIIMDKTIKISVENGYKLGGKIIAIIDSKEVGWLRYHHNFDNRRNVEITILEVLEKYKPYGVDTLLLSYTSKLFPRWRYRITNNYK